MRRRERASARPDPATASSHDEASTDFVLPSTDVRTDPDCSATTAERSGSAHVTQACPYLAHNVCALSLHRAQS